MCHNYHGSCLGRQVYAAHLVPCVVWTEVMLIARQVGGRNSTCMVARRPCGDGVVPKAHIGHIEPLTFYPSWRQPRRWLAVAVKEEEEEEAWRHYKQTNASKG